MLAPSFSLPADRRLFFALLFGSLGIGLTAALGSPTYALGVAFVVPALVVGLTVALLPPRDGFMMVVALLPLEAFGLMEVGFDVRPSYLVLFALAFGLSARGFSWWGELKRHRMLLLFLAISAVSVVFAGAVSGSNWNNEVAMRAGTFRSPLQMGLLVFHFLVFLLAAAFSADKDERRRLLKLYVGFGAVLAALGVYQTLAFYLDWPFKDITWAWDPAGSSTYRYGQVRLYDAGVAAFAPRATFRESMHFSHYLNSFVPLAWALAACKEARDICGWSRRAVAWIGVLGSLALLLTLSRSGWGAALAAALVLVLGLRGGRGILILLSSAVVLVGGFDLLRLAGVLPDALSLSGLISGRLSTATMVADPRVLYFAIFLQSFLAHPWLGLGVGNFALTGGAAYGSNSLHSAHGIFWSAAADSGVFAALALFGFFAFIVVRLWRLRSGSEGMLCVGLAASLVGMLSQNLFFGDRPELYLLFLSGVAAGTITAGTKTKTL